MRKSNINHIHVYFKINIQDGQGVFILKFICKVFNIIKVNLFIILPTEIGLTRIIEQLAETCLKWNNFF